MEADLHAIVRPFPLLTDLTLKNRRRLHTDPVWTTAHRRTLPVLPLPDPLRAQIYSQCQRTPP